MMITNKLKSAGFEVIHEIKGQSWHLFGLEGSLSSITVKVGIHQFEFVTNPGGCGSLMMKGNIGFKSTSKESFEKLCQILANEDAGTIFAVLGERSYFDHHQYMTEFGFNVVTEYPNLRHGRDMQRLYMKITPRKTN